MQTLTTQIESLKTQFLGLNPESKLTATIPNCNTGELMDAAINLNYDIVKPFEKSAEQNYYYFIVPVKQNIEIVVKSVGKIKKF